jgi:hypothetical protein
MKKLIATISLLILFISSQAQSPLYINKYLRDSLVGGFWYLYKDTTHTGQWGFVGGSGGGGGAVSSVFGRTGAVTAQSGDYSSFYPLLSNLATDFSTINNTKYPTTQAVSDYVTSQTIDSLFGVQDNVSSLDRTFYLNNNEFTFYQGPSRFAKGYFSLEGKAASGENLEMYYYSGKKGADSSNTEITSAASSGLNVWWRQTPSGGGGSTIQTRFFNNNTGFGADYNNEVTNTHGDLIIADVSRMSATTSLSLSKNDGTNVRNYLTLNFASDLYSFGDLYPVGNGNYLQIDNANQKLYFKKLARSDTASVNNVLTLLNASTGEVGFKPASGGGGVSSVSGTADRITSTGGATPVIDIAATYVGQTSITTLGTITTGVWNGTAIANANLANSSVTVNGTSISLGASGTVTAAAGTLTGATLNSTVTASSLTSFGNSPTIVTPTIASFANANHNHTNSAGGGQLTDAALSAAVGVTKGGTGVAAISAKSIWVANSANTITELTPGAGQSIRINAGNTAWEVYTPPSGGGDVSKVGTPANNQVGVWTGDGTIEGDANFTWSGTKLNVAGVAAVNSPNADASVDFTVGNIFEFDASGVTAYFQAYDRTAGYRAAVWDALTHEFKISGAATSAITINTSREVILNGSDAGAFNLQNNGDFYNTTNILMGGSSVATSATAAFHLFNGTAPSASVTNGVLLYSEDVAASAELKVRDEAGNITVLGPHTFTGIPGGRSEEMAWAFYSERDGKYINVDMLKLARAVEKLTGEKLVFIGKTTDELPNKENK